ncbi:MAG TPA: MBL fold metallo-hydrolase [Desulfomonilaceae bacterium]|nr:MBL fold metallo-hydrolase [Desulfomonilaceae bacterium]
MRVRTPGKVCDHLWRLGTTETGVYLLKGREESMIISGGMSYIVPSVMSQLNEFGLREDQIRALLILHSHFDHVGVVPFLHGRNPAMKIYASERAWQILSDPRSITTINDFSRGVTARMGLEKVYDEYELDWSLGIAGEKVSDGDIIDVGGIEIHILETPGHSSCSISAYVPQLRALFPSDGGGIPFEDVIVPAANSNYTQYMESLKKLQPLEVGYLCADHYGFVHGDEARHYMYRSLEAAQDEYSKLKEIYLRTRDVDVAAQEVASSFLAENPDYFLTREIYEGICRQQMKHVAKQFKGLP